MSIGQSLKFKSTRSAELARNPIKEEDSRIAEHLPWLMHVTPELVLTKDGSLLAAYELDGVDFDEDSADKLNMAIKEVKDAISGLDERFYIWMITDKRLKNEPDEWPPEVENFVLTELDESKRRSYQSNKAYTLKTHVFMLFTGDTGVYAFMESISRRMSEDGESFVSAFLSSLNPANNVRSAALHDARQLDTNINLAEGFFANFVNANTNLSFIRLGGHALDTALYRMANPTLTEDYYVEPVPSAMLDATLACSDVRFGQRVYAIHGPDRSKYACTTSLTGYPSTRAALINLLTIGAEFRICHVLKCMSYDTGRKVVQEWADYYRMTQSTFMQHVVAYVTGNEPQVDPGKGDLYQECVEALRRQMAENLGFSFQSISLTLYADDANRAQRLSEHVFRQMGGGMPFTRERIGLKSAVLSTLPGQWALNKRMMLANNELIANTLPLTTIYPGEPVSEHLSDIYNHPTPPLATFISNFGTEVHFDPYVRQVGHALVVMPTGGGKTTFVNYCLANFSRYPDAQVIIFDRDQSCRIITHLVGGSYLDLQEGMALNPMKHIRESDLERVRATDFIVRRIEEGGDKLSAEDRKVIFDTVTLVAQSESEPSLNTVFTMLTNDLQVKLHEWVEGGPYSYFGGGEDKLTMSNWTCIEMREIMKVDRLSRAFLDHAFTSISRMLDGRPTFIYVEEASFALNNPMFLDGLDEWLKTFRKKNAFVWLTVQSPESVTGVAEEKIRATLTDNVPNVILGANTRLEAHREGYKHYFGLSDDQVSMIGQLRPRRDYLRIAGSICRVLRTDFDDHVLALMRSESRFQEILDRHMNSGDPNWRENYLSEALSRK